MSELQELKTELARLQARVDDLERTEAAGAPMSRRTAFKALGAAAVGAAAGSIAFAAPAGAVDGGNVVIGNESQTAESPTVLRVDNGTTWANPDNVFGGMGVTDVATADLPSSSDSIASAGAVFGLVDGSEFGAGVVGQGFGAYGGWFASNTTALKVQADDGAGDGLGAWVNGAFANMKLGSSGSDLPDDTVNYAGYLRHSASALWFSVSSSGTGRWRRLTAANSAGAFTAITPVRVYDSRWTGPVAGVTLGVINPGATREISVADGRSDTGTVNAANSVPAGARAIAYNITVTNTVGGGFLNVTPGGTSSSSSTINWFASGVDLANSAIVGLSTTRTVRVAAGGTGPTNFIVDVTGYWL